ncbi:hypothetical protein AHAS_Ahas18G0090700 [Arachis hypogaea]
MARPNMGTEPIEGTTITLNTQPSPGFKQNCFNLIGRIITDRDLKFRAIKNSILESILNVSHDHMEFWIQAHGFPIKHLNKETAKTIRNLIGIVGEVEDPMKNRTLKRYFLCFRDAINITQPLQAGFWLNKDNKAKIWINFKYERLQDCFCLKCGIIGHEKKSYSKPTTMACWDSTKPRYNNELATERMRLLNTEEDKEK